MLRPATPLSILFLAAFALLLLSTLSTPIIKAIPLATYRGYNFGVWGFCRSNGDCSPIGIGYTTDGLFDGEDSDFSLPPSTRHSLASILIVHPVAAFLTLMCFALAVAAHFHGPAHSPRYLLALLILTFPTLLVSLLAFLVDLLLFVPHLQWGGWIVLAATIIITASGVVTCAMRRTLVSRKARKKRIAQNAEMNGENFYANRQPVILDPVAEPTMPRAESPPPLSGDTVVSKAEKSNDYGSFDSPMDDRIPLNRDQSTRSATPGGSTAVSGFGSQARDPYGNPMPPNGQYGRAGGPGGPPPPIYGRGRGGYPPRGAPRGGGFAPRGGMRGPPPPGWNGNGRGMGPPRGGMGPPMVAGAMGRGGRMPPPGYDNRAYNSRSPGPYGMPPMANSQQSVPSVPGTMSTDVPIGQAVGDGPHSPSRQNYALRDSDADVAGMVGLQQQRLGTSGSGSGAYAEEGYAPPRINWSRPDVRSQGSTQSPPKSSPTELPGSSGGPKRNSEAYIDDMEPRFAEPSNPYPQGQLEPPQRLQPNYSGENVDDRSRSPAFSDTSQYTSVSQRPINPRWRQDYGASPGPAYNPQSLRRPRQEDVVLAANPDFTLAGGRARAGSRGRGGIPPAGADGRYPNPV